MAYMNIVDMVSVIVASAILLGLMGSIALDGVKHRFKGTNERVVSAVDHRWNRLRVPLEAD